VLVSGTVRDLVAGSGLKLAQSAAGGRGASAATGAANRSRPRPVKGSCSARQYYGQQVRHRPGQWGCTPS
jgi:hypothetical protein